MKTCEQAGASRVSLRRERIGLTLSLLLRSAAFKLRIRVEPYGYVSLLLLSAVTRGANRTPAALLW